MANYIDAMNGKHTDGSEQLPKELRKKKATKAKASKPKKPKDDDLHCPVCRSEDIVGEEIMVESGEASQKCRCSNCSATWYNVYKFKCVQYID